MASKLRCAYERPRPDRIQDGRILITMFSSPVSTCLPRAMIVHQVIKTYLILCCWLANGTAELVVLLNPDRKPFADFMFYPHSSFFSLAIFCCHSFTRFSNSLMPCSTASFFVRNHSFAPRSTHVYLEFSSSNTVKY